MSSIRDEIERSTEGLPLLGYSVQWSLRGVQIQHNELVKALASCGFGRYTPDPPTPRKALRRAIESWVMGRSRAGHGPTLSWRYSHEDEESATPDQGQGQSRRQQMLVRTINQRDSEYLVFALVLEEADLQALGLSYGTDLRVLLRKSDLTIAITAAPTGRVNSGPTPPVAAELPDHWARYRNLHMAADLSRTVCQVVRDMGAISLRAGGGTYFVPPSAAGRLGRLRALVNKLEELSATKDGSARVDGPTGGTGSSREGSSFLLALGCLMRRWQSAVLPEPLIPASLTNLRCSIRTCSASRRPRRAPSRRRPCATASCNTRRCTHAPRCMPLCSKCRMTRSRIP
jgi:hypothetical protein